jgi:hypothetical protein
MRPKSRGRLEAQDPGPYSHYPWFAWYLERVRQAFRLTNAGRTVRLTWAGPELDAAGWREEFRAALDRRITSRMPWGAEDGRKYSDQYQLGLFRDARSIADKLQSRTRLYFLETPELQRRFAHLLSRHDDA